MKKLLYILIAILIALFIAFGVWYFLFSNQGKDFQIPFIENNENKNFFPVTNEGSPTPLFDNLEEDSNESSIGEDFVPRFRQISMVPTAGMISFEREATTTSELVENSEGELNQSPVKIFETVFRYIERGTGHIFETTERTVTQKRITNSTFPGVQKAFFNKTGDELFMQFLDNNNESIQTFHGTILEISTTTSSGTKITDGELQTKFFSSNVYDATISSDKDKIFYLSIDNTGTNFLQETEINSQSTRTITELSLSNWLIDAPNNKLLALTTKPHSTELGYLYFFDQEKGNKTKVLGPFNGLTSLTSPSGKHVLYSYTRGGVIETIIHDVQNDFSKTLNIATLPEKCVFNKDESYIYCGVPKFEMKNGLPELWYQGIISFNDEIWRIDINKDNDYKTVSILDPSETAATSFDVINPQLSVDEEYFLFINKKDLTLWSYDLAGI